MSIKSFGPLFLALGLMVGGPLPAGAQETPAPTPQAERHVVQLGETLWGLARLYLGDPLLWPEIYRLNTAVVEDPHWIFPGEELTLVPRDQTAVGVEQATPVVVEPAAPRPIETPPAGEPVEVPVELPEQAPVLAPAPPPTGRTVFARRERGGSNLPSLQMELEDRYRAVRWGDFYSAGFLTEGEKLPWAEVKGNADPGSIRGVAGASAIVYQVITVQAPLGATYQVGDSLVTVRLRRDVGRGWGDIVEPTALARVVHVSGRDVMAEITVQFGQVRAGQYALPAEPFRDPGTARAQPVTDGIQGNVIALRDPHPVPMQYDILFIDLGRNGGIAPGDVFEILPKEEDVAIADAPNQAMAELRIVHVRDRSATGVVTSIFTPGIRTVGPDGQGVPVRLVRKMPA